MYQGTTPTFILTLPQGVDLSTAESIYFTLKQGDAVVEKTGTDIVLDGQNVSIYLTQAETLKFKSGTAELQLNWTYSNGARACSVIEPVGIDPNLMNRVIE